VEIKICEKKQDCGHFLIKKLVQELGGLGNEIKIKTWEEFKEIKKKIEELIRAVKEFESEVIEYHNLKGCYPCGEVMEICWGQRKYLASFANMRKKKAYLKTRMEVKK